MYKSWYKEVVNVRYVACAFGILDLIVDVTVDFRWMSNHNMMTKYLKQMAHSH